MSRTKRTAELSRPFTALALPLPRREPKLAISEATAAEEQRNRRRAPKSKRRGSAGPYHSYASAPGAQPTGSVTSPRRKQTVAAGGSVAKSATIHQTKRAAQKQGPTGGHPSHLPNSAEACSTWRVGNQEACTAAGPE